MPLSRYRIKNEYALADPELYREADKDDPEAILEGVAMAGLVGLLRQLGDLAEFAAEIFHDLHEEVMATAARGHGLLVRVQQLEAEIPSIERRLLSQTSHSSLLYNSGDDWHPNLRMEQNLITRGDVPRFIMHSYEECRGPPRLFHLDKFDVAGAGACLKRYTDPSYFKVDGLEISENQRENNTRKAKKKGSLWKNGETPQALPKGQTRLHDLLQEERVQNHVNVPAPHVKLKKRLSEFPCNLKSGGRSYMEKFVKINSTELDVVRETSVSFTSLVPCNGGSLSSIEEFDANAVNREDVSPKRSSFSSSEINDTLPKPSVDQLTEEDNYELLGVTMDSSSETYEIFSPLQQVDEKEIEVHRERKMEGSNSFRSDDITSDVDNYMDALATIDSDIESDIEYRDNSYKYLHNVEDLSKQQENLSDSPDSGPVGSFSSLTDNGNLSSSGELSERSSEGIESSDYGRVEDSHRLSEQTLHDLKSMPTQPLERICNDIHVVGEEQQTSSSRRPDSYPLTLSLDLERSLEGDASEHSESSEVCSITNNEAFVPSDDAQNFLPASSSERQLDDQDQAVTLPIIGKSVQSDESNKYADFIENTTEGNNSGDAVDSYKDKIFLDVSLSKDSMDTITGEPDIHVKDSCDSQMDSCDSQMDSFHFAFLRIDEQPESFVEQGEKQLEFSVLHEKDSEEKPQMLVSHAEEQHQFVVSHSEEESQLSELSYTKEDQNQLVVSNKEDQPQLVVVDIEMQRKPFVTQAEEQPQLTSSHEEQPQLTPSPAEEEQLQLITSSTEPSQESLDAISPVELCLELMDNLEVDRASVADDGENVNVSSDVLCDEATNTEQSKAKEAVSVACDMDDVYLSMNFVEESQPVGESIPSSYFLVKTLESPNNLDQEEVGVPWISRFPSFDLPGPSHTMFDEMPPLPPLPPVQWRIPKIQHALSSQLDHEIRIPHPFSTFSASKEEISHHEFNLSSVSTFSSIKDSPISDETHLNPDQRNLQEKLIEPLDSLAPETSSENENSSLALTTMETKEVDHPHDMNEEKPPPSVSYSSCMFAHVPEVEDERLNGGLRKKIPRPRNPLIDAVVALDKTKLRKVTDRITPPPFRQKHEERDSFLEELRSKSFNLRPTAGARPSIQGPKTNLRVAAILEKANSIRQAHAGSDDDDDDDSWSDS